MVQATLFTEEPPMKKSTRFTPPTVDEVAEYCDERRNTIDPEAFVDFYASKGWLVGKSKMVDWKAAMRTWERRSGVSASVANDPRGNLETAKRILGRIEG